MAHPVVRSHHCCAGKGAGQVRNQAQLGRVIGDGFGDLAEGVEHWVHERRVEGVGNGEPFDFCRGSWGSMFICTAALCAAFSGQGSGDGADRVIAAGDDDAGGAIYGCNGNFDTFVRRCVRRNGLLCLGWGRRDGDHRAVVGQGTYQTTTICNQAKGIFQAEDTGYTRCCHLAHAMAQERCRLDPPGEPELRQGIFQGEEGGLGVGCVVNGEGWIVDLGGFFAVGRGVAVVSLRVEHCQQRLSRIGLVEFFASIQGGAEAGFGGIEFASHAGILGTLAGEKKSNSWLFSGGQTDADP